MSQLPQMHGPFQLLRHKSDLVYALELLVPELLKRPAAVVPMASSVLVSALVVEVAQPSVITGVVVEASEFDLLVYDLWTTQT